VFVEIYVFDTGEVVERMGPMPERRADRVADGASINLNHNKYGVRIVTE
jgi:hypothetical protein